MASLQETSSANRVHIGFFGKRNSGKSSLLNALAEQAVSIVSQEAGTTTDPVSKPMEIAGLGPCVLVDTAGFDDTGILGSQRVEKTRQAAERVDIALLLCTQGDLEEEKAWYACWKEQKVPVILIISKADQEKDTAAAARRIERLFGELPVVVSAATGTGLKELRDRLLRALPQDYDPVSITGMLAGGGDTVLLVMPQDEQAPKGRLILPQVQTIRELLDKNCIVLCVTPNQFPDALAGLKEPPKLIITDSQVFRQVYEQKPEESMLTSFSVLFAAYKGDIEYYIQSASCIGHLTDSSRVLIAECCTHAPLDEDIGRVKLPRLLRKKCGEGLRIDVAGGMDFPEDLTEYDLIIQCGACMFHRRYVMARIGRARKQGVPMTNYGVAIAYLAGILDQVAIVKS